MSGERQYRIALNCNFANVIPRLCPPLVGGGWSGVSLQGGEEGVVDEAIEGKGEASWGTAPYLLQGARFHSRGETITRTLALELTGIC